MRLPPRAQRMRELRMSQAAERGLIDTVQEEPLHVEPRHPAHNRQIRNQRRELGTELAHDSHRQRGLRRRPARGTVPPVTAVFGDLCRDRRYFRHWVPSRVADVVVGVQRPAAVTTRPGRDRWVVSRSWSSSGSAAPIGARDRVTRLAYSTICRSRSASSRRKRSTSCFRRSFASVHCCRLGRDTSHTGTPPINFVHP